MSTSNGILVVSLSIFLSSRRVSTLTTLTIVPVRACFGPLSGGPHFPRSVSVDPESIRVQIRRQR